MKITDNKKVSGGTLFMALNTGDVFDTDPNETAVRLDNGYRCYVRGDMPVHVLDAELVIRR